MSAEHDEHSERDTSTPRPALRAASLSALEEAMRRALESASREQVLERVLTTLSDETDEDVETGYRDKVQKVSVSMPADLTEAVRRRTGTGGFSRYVSDAVQDRVYHDQLGDLLDELEAEYGPVPPEIREQTRLMWPDTNP